MSQGVRRTAWGRASARPGLSPHPSRQQHRAACRRPGAVTKGCHPTGPGGLRAEEHTAKNCGTLASPPLLRVRRLPLTRAGQALPVAGARTSAHPTGNQAPQGGLPGHPSSRPTRILLGKGDPLPYKGDPPCCVLAPHSQGPFRLSFKALPSAPTRGGHQD